MKDRQPSKPNRVYITPQNGADPFYAVMTRADEPIEPGHRLNKHTLLKDATCRMLSLDPQTAVPDDALQILAAIASSTSTSDLGELEDLTICTGSFTNTGAGWNSFHFPEAFDAPPQVVLQPLDFLGFVEVRQVTATGFLYCLREFVQGSVTTGTYYTSNDGYNVHSKQTLVNAVTPSSYQTTDRAVTVAWTATESNGGID